MIISLNMPSGNHAMVGYGLEQGKWRWDGRDYDRRILIWDPNNPNALKDEACFYINTRSFDYCVPLYEVIYENSTFGLKQGLLSSCSNDLNILLPAEYPFTVKFTEHRGDLNCDGTADVSDAVMLARFLAEDKKLRISDEGIRNAETDGEAGLSVSDLTMLLKIIAKIFV